ncbi:MAG: hypothetical protein GEU87_18550 [Alphaproteobacteria bacterium]|nr:hypothetical protein [Alphaproteobacteria bacterium]
MSADALKKLLLTAAVAALAAVALAGTAVAVIALAGGLEGSYIACGTSAAAVSSPSKSGLGVAGHGKFLGCDFRSQKLEVANWLP